MSTTIVGRGIELEPTAIRTWAEGRTILIELTDGRLIGFPENFTTLEEFWEFWDIHSSEDYEDVTEPVEAEIVLSSEQVYCPIAKMVWLQEIH